MVWNGTVFISHWVEYFFLIFSQALFKNIALVYAAVKLSTLI